MKNLELRGKCKKTKEWVYGYAVKRGSEWFIDYETTNWKSAPPLGKIEYHKVKVEENTIGQYVGFHIPHCESLYEGDIVKFKVYDGLADIEGTSKIYFGSGAFRLNWLHPLCDYTSNGEVKKIGNVYDNPELLEELV